MVTPSQKRKRDDEEEGEENRGDSSDISDQQLLDIVCMVHANNNVCVPRSIFSAERVCVNTRFNHSEYIYEVTVGSNNMSTLPDFLNNMRCVFQYLINVMKYNASSGKNKARFYISKDPKSPFSTAILNVDDFRPHLFFNIFERHMQSNAQELINNGWSSLVSIYIFPNRYVRPQTIKRQKNIKSLYKDLGKNPLESGSGHRTAQKHRRETRNGVFQVGAGNVKHGCFALALLVGKSFLQKDKRYDVLNTNRNANLTALYAMDEITNVYTTAGVCVGHTLHASFFLCDML
jgi:hypothetical protein